MEPSPSSDPEPAARLIGATRQFGSVTAIDDVTLDVPRQRLTAVVGPSGSGKSTLLHCLAGLEPLTSGEVWLDGVGLHAASDRERTVARRRVGVVFQRLHLHRALNVLENIRLPLRIAGGHVDDDWVARVLAVCAVERLLDRLPGELSGGEQQRVAAARALAGQPALVLADEPTGNLDGRSGAALLDLLRVAVSELGQTVVLATHDLRTAMTGDRVVGMGDGHLVGTTDAPTWDEVVALGLGQSVG